MAEVDKDWLDELKASVPNQEDLDKEKEEEETKEREKLSKEDTVELTDVVNEVNKEEHMNDIKADKGKEENTDEGLMIGTKPMVKDASIPKFESDGAEDNAENPDIGRYDSEDEYEDNSEYDNNEYGKKPKRHIDYWHLALIIAIPVVVILVIVLVVSNVGGSKKDNNVADNTSNSNVAETAKATSTPKASATPSATADSDFYLNSIKEQTDKDKEQITGTKTKDSKVSNKTESKDNKTKNSDKTKDKEDKDTDEDKAEEADKVPSELKQVKNYDGIHVTSEISVKANITEGELRVDAQGSDGSTYTILDETGPFNQTVSVPLDNDTYNIIAYSNSTGWSWSFSTK